MRDYNGYVWTVEVKGRINCSGAEQTHMGTSAGVARAAATRVMGSKRFRIPSGTSRAVRVPLRPAARRQLRLMRVMRLHAVVRTGRKVRKSKPFTVLKR